MFKTLKMYFVQRKCFLFTMANFFVGQKRLFIGKTIIFAEKPFCTVYGGVLLQRQISFLTI